MKSFFSNQYFPMYIFKLFTTKYSRYFQVKWGASSWWSSSLYYPMRNSNEKTIGKTHPTLVSNLLTKSSIISAAPYQRATIYWHSWWDFIQGWPIYWKIIEFIRSLPMENYFKWYWSWRNCTTFIFFRFEGKIHLGTIQIEPSSFKTDLLSISQ